MNQINLDATDIKLLRLLQEDARLTTKQLAAKVNLAVAGGGASPNGICQVVGRQAGRGG